MEKKADILFEISWEICNKVGGIYTVVKSKAGRAVENYGDNYYMVGPYLQANTLGEFSEEPPTEILKSAFEELKELGLICHYGKWLIEGSPQVILIDFVNFRAKIDEIKTELWESYKIDSMRAPPDYDEPVSWAHTVGILIEKISNKVNDKKIVAHFHEWLSGAGLLYLKKRNLKIATVFTTHATILGRTLASSNVPLYDVWDKLDPDKEAYDHFIEGKYLVEKNSALNADVFTTVSEITGMESSHFLRKKPDLLLPNGLDISKFLAFDELVVRHRLQRDRIREFLMYYFFPYYSFDLEKTTILFTAARYEYHNKGIDIYIKSLSKLNDMLKKANSDKTIIAFVWVPGNFRNVKTEILENKTLYQDIKDELDENGAATHKKIVYSFATDKKITQESIFSPEFLKNMRIKKKKFQKSGNPPVSTHDMYDENEDILNGFKEANLQNSKDDPVKVIFYPIYLSGADGILNLNYYEAMEGAHLGIFPSYYEPWGYTPLEAGALGIPSITTDLAGFGRFFCNECSQTNTAGIFVLNRFGKKDDDVIYSLSKRMFNFVNLSKEDRISNRVAARKIASIADWKLFIENYIKAHNLAVEKVYGT
jgi:glycogen synthase